MILDRRARSPRFDVGIVRGEGGRTLPYQRCRPHHDGHLDRDPDAEYRSAGEFPRWETGLEPIDDQKSPCQDEDVVHQ